MADIDLNLLVALDALLAEGSVAGAARRLGLSASAMSRTLARLREVTGDALLVRAGRDMVATPRAAALRERVRDLTQAAQAVLGPASEDFTPAALTRTFIVRANDGFVETFAARLIDAAAAQAPGVCLCFVPKPDKGVAPLREGLIDLDVGVMSGAGPELRVQALFRDHFVAAVRAGHPLAGPEPVTAARYAACGHVATSRRGKVECPVDVELAELGLRRRIVAMVPSFSAALAVARASDLVALVPSFLVRAQQPEAEGALRVFPLPVDTAPITVSQMWHPRLDADPAHRWLRGLMLSICRGDASPL